MSLIIFAIIFLAVLANNRNCEVYCDGINSDYSCPEPNPPSGGKVSCYLTNLKYLCNFKCIDGYKFPSGDVEYSLSCNNSSKSWEPTDVVIPDCSPICDKPCQNGGICGNPNHCICPKDFRGSNCEFPISNCDPQTISKSIVNWKCNHTSYNTSCVITCPLGTKFQTEPESNIFTCNLLGSWHPSYKPLCVRASSNVFFEVENAKTSFATSLKNPSSGTCTTWGKNTYRTFDGRIFQFSGACSYVLFKDCLLNTFQVLINNEKDRKTLSIYVQDMIYYFYHSGAEFLVKVGDKLKTLPVFVDKFSIQQVAHYVIIRHYGFGFRIQWDGYDFVSAHMEHTRNINKTCGLCGHRDKDELNDFQTSDGRVTDDPIAFADSWKRPLNECIKTKPIKNDCQEFSSGDLEYIQNSENVCLELKSTSFQECHNVLNPDQYFDICKKELCVCKNCICDTFAEYARECMRLGVKFQSTWRRNDFCPRNCSNGTKYSDCGSSCPLSCKKTTPGCNQDFCVDGCFCPHNSIYSGGKCIAKEQCPCEHSGKIYKNGDNIQQDCNQCVCERGKWKCSKEKCGTRCSSIGDSTYTTFDGKKYTFYGICSYYLVYGANYSIAKEMTDCLTTESLNGEKRSCKQVVVIQIGVNVYKISKDFNVLKNGKKVKLPLSTTDIQISKSSSIFYLVNLKMGLTVLFDGKSRLYIDTSSSLYDNTAGLCGTFNDKQSDDYWTPDGDVETDVVSFANKWKVSTDCSDDSKSQPLLDACEVFSERRQSAIDHCSMLKGEIFKDCHEVLSPESFYESCLQTMCTCSRKIEDCLCDLLADYSSQCSKILSKTIDWRSKVPHCSIKCPGSQIFKHCVSMCHASCADISKDIICTKECEEGCSCDAGLTLDAFGECIPFDICPCIYKNKEFKAGTTKLINAEICKCKTGKWNCTDAKLDAQDKGQGYDTLYECQGKNMEYSECKDSCQLSCSNYHSLQKCESNSCDRGCQCKKGYLYDEFSENCVSLEDCSCQHANQFYRSGETLKINCNKCLCNSGLWDCEKNECPSICTVWGESHFKTFDGKIYDFTGECDYVLAKSDGNSNPTHNFLISVQNIPCSSTGLTCSKSVSVVLGDSLQYTLSVDKEIPESVSERIIVRKVGMFVYVYTDVGISIQWDKGTRIYIRLSPYWKSKVLGLCGNFNGDQNDDFLTPFGGLPEINVNIFADSWKLQSCKPSMVPVDSCRLESARSAWAHQKCSVLQGDLFAPCHSFVPVNDYYKRCLIDTCACDLGGDCDCLCTAIATYAQECSMQGVHIKWRSQQLCPIQCDAKCSEYEPCISPCPRQTCNDRSLSKVSEECKYDICVEGCRPPRCPEGQVYNNEQDYKCIPKFECKIFCKVIDGKTYYEGERIINLDLVDQCQNCHCQRGEISCVGQPCMTVPSTSFSTSIEHHVSESPTLNVCVAPGWTKWMNSFVANEDGDFETIQGLRKLYNFCPDGEIIDQECREASSQNLAVASEELKCSLSGLTCLSKDSIRCPDYEIRFYCRCNSSKCEEPLGMNSGYIKNSQITSLPSSDVSGDVGRLLSSNPWEPPSYQQNPTLMIDLGEQLKVTGIIIQGSPTYGSRVTLFKVIYSIDGSNWIPLTNDKTGREISLEGNVDTSEAKKVMFPNSINGRFLRIIPKLWIGKISMRLEILGCNVKIEKTSSTSAPTTRATTESEMKIKPNVCGWTEWFNTDSSEGNGDVESVDVIRGAYGLCPESKIVDIECTYKPHGSVERKKFSLSGQFGLKCSIADGFQCFNDLQAPGTICYDYSIRFFCACPSLPYLETTTAIYTTPSTTVTSATTEVPYFTASTTGATEGTFTTSFASTTSLCTPGYIFDECAIDCKDGVCHAYQYLLITSKICDLYNRTCIPGCRPIDYCKNNEVLADDENCINRQDCSCYGPKGVMAPNSIIEGDCMKCQCFNNTLECSSILDCQPTGMPFQKETTTTTTTTTTTSATTTETKKPAAECTTGWTSWMSNNLPNSVGELENIDDLRNSGYTFCSEDMISSVQCGIVQTDEYGKRRIDIGVQDHVSCSLNQGLVCQSSNLGYDSCYDYAIRFYCSCVSAAPSTTEILSSTIFRTASTPSLTTVLQPSKTEVSTPVPITEKFTTTSFGCTPGWTSWMSNNLANSIGDMESMDDLRNAGYQFCSKDMISNIQCGVLKTDNNREKNVDIDIQDHVTCNLEQGLICQNSDLLSNLCYDYVIRFYCSCVSTAHSTIASTPLTEPSTIGPITSTPLTSPPTSGYIVEVCNGLLERNVQCSSCPSGKLCNGTDCVDPVNCPCYFDGSIYQVEQSFVSSNCEKCYCFMKNDVKCEKIKCTSCTENQIPYMNDYCECRCRNCSEGTRLCPTNNLCLNETKWCDNVIDCPDDEVNCPIPPGYACPNLMIPECSEGMEMTLVDSTAECPSYKCAPMTKTIKEECDMSDRQETNICQLDGNYLTTFDDSSYDVQICHHILLNNRNSSTFNIQVAKKCKRNRPCFNYVIITTDYHKFEIFPNKRVKYKGISILRRGLDALNKRYEDFEATFTGRFFVFKSLKYKWEFYWDLKQWMKVKVSNCLKHQINGLCGLYDGITNNDMETHDGLIITEIKQFTESWSIADDTSTCAPTICPIAHQQVAIRACSKILNNQFRKCVTLIGRVNRLLKACISRMCQCMQSASFEECQCFVLLPFVNQCETRLGTELVRWRIDTQCAPPKCPPGLEWRDCGSACEMTCQNYRQNKICSSECVAGCFCPTGMVRIGDTCATPDKCYDCTCKGYGDSYFFTFDGRYYSFRSDCTYILAQDRTQDSDHLFQVLIDNSECSEKGSTSCTNGIIIRYNNSEARIFQDKPIKFNGVNLKQSQYPFYSSGFVITSSMMGSGIVSIGEINLLVIFHGSNQGYSISLPSHLFYDKTEGLCGVCNFDVHDDTYHRGGYVEENTDKFASSWLADERKKDECIKKVEKPTISPPTLCNFTTNKCSDFVNPGPYLASCIADSTNGISPGKSLCRAMVQYAVECCQSGISLVQWLKSASCDYMCPDNFELRCDTGCRKTCENYGKPCTRPQMINCFCPDNKVLKNGKCVDFSECKSCDSEGHGLFDIWSVSPCETCHCTTDMKVKCIKEQCQPVPSCAPYEILRQRGSNSTCCKAYYCEPQNKTLCPWLDLPTCGLGQVASLKFENGCSAYECVCNNDSCPAIEWPKFYESGLKYSVNQSGCCKQLTTYCDVKACPERPKCPTGTEIKYTNGTCCTLYDCVKKNVCLFVRTIDIVNGIEVPVRTNLTEEFQIGEAWKNGYCTNCSCQEDLTAECSVQECSRKENDIEYVYEYVKVGGKCCPEEKRIACIYNGNRIEIGEEIVNSDDSCKSMKCSFDATSQALIVNNEKECVKNCDVGYEYVEPLASNKECCGNCVHRYCIENYNTYSVGNQWQASYKKCYMAECIQGSSGVEIIYTKKNCPLLPNDCPKNETIYDDDGCCLVCKVETGGCLLREVPKNETKELFKKTDVTRGTCSNDYYIEDEVRICAGLCTPGINFSEGMDTFMVSSYKCQPDRFEMLKVPLTCTDGTTSYSLYKNPTSCDCVTCPE